MKKYQVRGPIYLPGSKCFWKVKRDDLDTIAIITYVGVYVISIRLSTGLMTDRFDTFEDALSVTKKTLKKLSEVK